MLPVHRSNLKLANSCIKHILENCDFNIIVIDDFGNDSDYIQNDRVSFVHNTFTERQPLAAIWNQCIELCPTDNVIIYSWRQRLSKAQFDSIPIKLEEGFAAATFDGLHVFGFNKFLISKIGLFDSGFKLGQYEDTDWWYRLKYYNLAIFCDDNVAEERVVDGSYINSTWLDPAETNKKYFITKWQEVKSENKIILYKLENNFDERVKYEKFSKGKTYKFWADSVLTPGLKDHFETYRIMESKLNEN